MTNRNARRSALHACGLLLILLATPCVVCSLMWRQATLNRELISAVTQVDADKTRALLLRGADANAVVQQGDEESVEPRRWWNLSSYLRRSSENRSCTVLQLAVEDYHSKNYPHSYFGSPALVRLPGYFGTPALVRLLVQYGADVNVRDDDGTPLLCFAARNDDPEVVALLLEHRARINAQESSGETPLFRAAQTNDARKTRLLLEKGADANIANAEGESPMSEAASWNSAEIVKMLLGKGADSSHRDHSGRTALHVAVSGNNHVPAEVLLKAQADNNAQDSSGSTPLMLAARGGYDDLISLLLRYGANMDYRDNSGKTARSLAGTRSCQRLLDTALLASINADNDTGYSGRQIVNMGLGRFTDIYCSQPQHRKHPDESAAQLYRAYKELDNERHIAELAPLYQKQIKPLCVALREWEQTAWYLRCDYRGGGTAWISSMIVSSGCLEEFLGQVIGRYAHSPQSSGRDAYHPTQAMRGGSPLLDYCEKLLTSSPAYNGVEFRRTLTLLRTQTATLNRTLLHQSPSVQRLVNKHLADFRPDM